MSNELDEGLKKNRQEIDEMIENNLNEDSGKPSGQADTPQNDGSGQPEGQGDTPQSGGEEQADPTPQINTNNNTVAVSDGVSRAYVDDNLTGQKLKTSVSEAKSWPKAPDHKKKDVKVAGGKDIMEVFWNEMWAFYDKIIDTAVDITLDFVTFVLYPERKAPPVKKDVKKADAMAAGEKVFNKKITAIRKIQEQAHAVHGELSRNLENAMNGEVAEWTIFKKEPNLFPELVHIRREAEADPQSAYAENMKNFNNAPEFIDKLIKNDENIIKLAVYVATMEEFLNPVTKDMEINRVKAAYPNPEEQKRKLEEVEEIYKDPEKEQEKMEERISKRSDEYEMEIIKNINKIREVHKDNPEEMKSVIGSYMEQLSTLQTETFEGIYKKMYMEKDNSKKTKDNAQICIDKFKDCMSGFMVDGRTLQDIPQAKDQKDINAKEWTKWEMLKVIKGYTGRD